MGELKTAQTRNKLAGRDTQHKTHQQYALHDYKPEQSPRYRVREDCYLIKFNRESMVDR